MEKLLMRLTTNDKKIALPVPNWHFWEAMDDPEFHFFDAYDENQLVDGFRKAARSEEVGVFVLVDPLNPQFIEFQKPQLKN